MDLSISFIIAFVDADQVRKEYDESSTKLSDIQEKISSLTEKLKQDFGKMLKELALSGYFVFFPPTL